MARNKRTPARGGDRGSKKHRATKLDKSNDSKEQKGTQQKPAVTRRPDLAILDDNLPSTSCVLRNLIATAGKVFDRGTPCKLVRDVITKGMIARSLTVEGVVHEAHRVSRPVRIIRTKSGSIERIPITLPIPVARLYLDLHGEWNLLPLNGITSAPILRADGSIHAKTGYDKDTGLWCEVDNLPLVPAVVTNDLAAAALNRLRFTFRTFPFGDSPRVWDPTLGVHVVDLSQQPGQDESTFLAGLMTGVCRPSLWLAPGLILVAPMFSGAGTGKGLLARAICLIAFDRPPQAFTPGHDLQEFDKRMAAELIGGFPAVFVDNVNNVELKSDSLASAITERPARVRRLGKSEMLQLNSTAFFVITGNGLSLAEDLLRRFLQCHLDAKMEDPEQRPFEKGFLNRIREDRNPLLGDVLTIWRFGRQNSRALKRGKPLGSFEMWSEWVRDPLLALGCADPIARITEYKAADQRRMSVADLFAIWLQRHGEKPVKASTLDSEVVELIDPQGRGRQFVASQLDHLVGTRVGGMTLSASRGDGKWSVTTYAVLRIGP